MKSQTFFTFILSFVINSHVNGTETLFGRRYGFDDLICTAQQYLGVESISHCSAACAQEASCVGFFFKSTSMECLWTSVVHTDPAACQTSTNTLYYVDASVQPITTSGTATPTTSTTTSTTTTAPPPTTTTSTTSTTTTLPPPTTTLTTTTSTTTTSTTTTSTTTTTTTTTPPPPTCPSGWTTYMNHCYLQDWSDRSWSAASSNCVSYGGYMLSVETEAEYTFIQNNFDSSIAWIGATDAAAEGVWVWDSGAAVTLNHWKPLKPDNSDYNCHCMAVNMIWETWEWEDVNCYHTYRSVCEIDLSS